MAVTKIEKHSKEYYTIKGMYEIKMPLNVIREKLKEDCKIEISRKTIERFATEGKWERGKSKSVYEATKLVEMDKVLNEFKSKPEKIAAQTISKKAKDEGVKKAELILQSENYKIEMENKLAQVGMKYLDKFEDALDNIKNGKVVDTEIEGIVIDDNGKPANIIKKTTVLRPKEFEKIVGMMQAFGILQTTPTVTMQVNNTNAQQNNNADIKVETQFSKISEQEAFQEFCKKIGSNN